MPAGQTRQKMHLFALFAAVLLLFVVLCIGRVAEMVIVAALLAYVLDPVVTFFERRNLSRAEAATLIMLLIGALVLVFWYTVIPIVMAQLKAMQAAGSNPASHSLIRIEGQINGICESLGLRSVKLTEEFGRLKNLLVLRLPTFILNDSPTLLISLTMTPFVTFFFLKDARSFKKYFISLVPNRYFEFTLDLLHKMEVQLGNYLRGQLVDAIVFGVLATAVLWALHVPYFVFIGIFSGLANLIPFVGPLAGASAAMAAVVIEQGDIVRGAYVALAFVGLKLLDDFLIQPLVVGKHVDLHPMVIALAILVGGHLFGVLGMLLAVPLLGFLQVVMKESIDTFRGYRFD
jgi:putative permease